MRSYMEFHASIYDAEVQRAYEIVQGLNPAAEPVPLERISVVPPELEDKFRETFDIRGASGRFNYRDETEDPVNFNSIFVIRADSGRPVIDRINLLRQLAHELTHSITFTPSRSYHRFYAEVLAGFGELALLRELQATDEFIPARSKSFFQLGHDDQLVRIFNPAEIRSLDARETNGCLGEKATMSVGSMGAVTLEAAIKSIGLPLSGEKIVQLSRPGDTRGLNVMKYVLRSLDLDLPKQIEVSPQYDTEAQRRAVYLIQHILRRNAQNGPSLN